MTFRLGSGEAMLTACRAAAEVVAAQQAFLEQEEARRRGLWFWDPHFIESPYLGWQP